MLALERNKNLILIYFVCTYSYIEVKLMLSATLQFIEKKNWEKVREYGNLAMDKLPDVLKGESLR